MHYKTNIGDKFGDLTLVNYVDEPYEIKQARIEKAKGKKTKSDTDDTTQTFGYFRCSCGRHEIKNLINVKYGNPECNHRKRMSKKNPYYGEAKVPSLNQKFITIQKEFGEDRTTWKNFTEFYLEVVLKVNDMQTSLNAIGIKKKVMISIKDGEDAANNDTLVISTEQRKKEPTIDIGVQKIDGKEYSSLVSISKEFDIPISTVYRRFKRGKRDSQLVRKK